MPHAFFDHDPQARLDYAVPFDAWLADGDDITVVETAVVPAGGLTVEQASWTTPNVVLWVSGGDPNVDYDVTIHVETAQGREDDRTIRFACRQR